MTTKGSSYFSLVIIIPIALLILIGILLICREGICWYFKINERRDILKSIKNQLSEILEKIDNNSNSETD